MLLLLPLLFFGQPRNEKLPLDLNTIFVTIDADSYSKLFENPFVKDTLFICRNNATSTDKEKYSGKYFIGKSATIEFFTPMNTTATGDTFGDVGIEFKTRKINQLRFFENAKTKTDTTFFRTDSLNIAWYKNLSIALPSPHLQVSLLEYQKEYLNYLGFSEEEINTEMTYDHYNSILSGGKKYPRKFNAIKSIELDIDAHEKDYLIQSIKNLGGTASNGKLLLNGIVIIYHLSQTEIFRIRKISIDLTEAVPTKTIVISNALKIKTIAKTAEILFEY